MPVFCRLNRYRLSIGAEWVAIDGSKTGLQDDAVASWAGVQGGFQPFFNVRRRAALVALTSERPQLERVLDDDIQPVDVIAALAAVGAMGDMGQL